MPAATSTWASLFSVYYHAAFRERQLTHPASLPGHVGLVALEDAAEHLGSVLEGAPNDLQAVSHARLASAHLARHGHPERAHPAHRTAVLALDAAFQSTGLPSAMIGAAGAGQRYPVRNYAVSWAYENRISDVIAGMDVQRPLRDFRKCLDPRRWGVDLPMTWRKTAPLVGLPMDRLDDGVVDRAKNRAPAGFGPTPFFEHAVWPCTDFEISSYRNLLVLEIHLPTSGNTLEFRYWQRECLTATFLGAAPFAGGIDVDDGFGRCRKLGGGWCRLEARKRSRFSLPEGPLNVAYNDLASVWLLMFIESLVVTGTQLPP